MHEATVTIKKLWPPYKAGDKRTNLDDTDGNRYRIDIITGAGFHDGEVVDIGYTEEKTTPEFGGKEYKLIKKIKLVATGGALSDQAQTKSRVTLSDVGPHIGMWEKRASELRVDHGMSNKEIHQHIVECRQIARDGVRADIDNKPQDDPNDSLEDDTYF